MTAKEAEKVCLCEGQVDFRQVDKISDIKKEQRTEEDFRVANNCKNGLGVT